PAVGDRLKLKPTRIGRRVAGYSPNRRTYKAGIGKFVVDARGVDGRSSAIDAVTRRFGNPVAGVGVESGIARSVSDEHRLGFVFHGYVQDVMVVRAVGRQSGE